MVAVRRAGKHIRAKVIICDAKRTLRTAKSRVQKQIEKAQRDKYRRSYIVQLLSTKDEECCDILRMNKAKFNQLCEVLEFAGGMKERPELTIQERVAIFLIMLGQGSSTGLIKHIFWRSAGTINSCFNEVLQCILELQNLLIAQPVPVTSECEDEPWSNFEGCVGVVDVCRFPHSNQYLLGACGSDFRFSYLKTEHAEKKCSDARLLCNVYNGSSVDLHPVPGTYYLVGANMPLMNGYLPPFRSISKLNPAKDEQMTARELYNKKHEVARKAMSVAFALVQHRFKILRTVHENYLPAKQLKILLAACLLHNFCVNFNEPLEQFMRLEMTDLAETYMPEHLQVPRAGYGHQYGSSPTEAWINFRNSVADKIFCRHFKLPDRRL